MRGYRGGVSSTPPGIWLAIVDDDPMVRAALGMMLGGNSGISVVGEASNGEEALRVVPASARSGAHGHPDAGARRAERDQVLLRDPSLKIIVLTTFDADDMVLRALRMGAAGFMLKDTSPARLVEAVRTVAAGQPMLSPSVTAQLIAAVAGPDSGADDAPLPGPGWPGSPSESARWPTPSAAG